MGMQTWVGGHGLPVESMSSCGTVTDHVAVRDLDLVLMLCASLYSYR